MGSKWVVGRRRCRLDSRLRFSNAPLLEAAATPGTPPNKAAPGDGERRAAPERHDVAPRRATMDPGYTIATARLQDVHGLAAIERAAATLLHGHAPPSVLNESTDESDFRRAQADGRLWVALADDTPVGFALVEMLAKDRPHLEEIDVHPQHGRRGVGTALLRAVCEWVSRSGYSEMTLTTFRAVPWNKPFYSRLGFEAVSTDELRPELAAVVQDETARGLDPQRRVVMRYRIGEPHRGRAPENYEEGTS